MSKLRIGELFAGYGGLALGIEEVMDAEVAWYAEYDAAPSKIMAHHYPHLTNYGDVTAVDWSTVPPVDIISGGSPCQDLSLAGRRKGMTDGTRSNLWESMREAIATIKPTYVVWENVRGALSATATSDSDMGQRAGFLGERGGHLRALGRVLGDLADLGYDCQWRGLRAADVGAPHGRFRVFILATRRDAVADLLRGRSGGRATLSGDGLGAGANAPAYRTDDRPDQPGAARATSIADADLQRCEEREQPAVTAEPEHPAPGGNHGVLPGRGHDGRTRGANGRFAPLADASGREPERRGRARVVERQAGPRESEGEERQRIREAVGDSSSGTRGEATADTAGIGGEERRAESARVQRGPDAIECGSPTDWGIYAPAIRRWEAVRGTAPAPTELTAKGKHRLSAAFCEWMMGVPAGWITDVPGVSRNEQLKAAGNGVVPQQAAEALRDMLGYSVSMNSSSAARMTSERFTPSASALALAGSQTESGILTDRCAVPRLTGRPSALPSSTSRRRAS